MKFNKLSIAIASCLVLMACKPNDLTYVIGSSTYTASTSTELTENDVLALKKSTVIESTQLASPVAVKTTSYVIPGLLGGGLLLGLAAGSGGGGSPASANTASVSTPDVKPPVIFPYVPPTSSGAATTPVHSNKVDKVITPASSINTLSFFSVESIPTLTKKDVLDKLQVLTKDDTIKNFYKDRINAKGKYEQANATTWVDTTIQNIKNNLTSPVAVDFKRKARPSKDETNLQEQIFTNAIMGPDITVTKAISTNQGELATFNASSVTNLYSKGSLAPLTGTDSIVITSMDFSYRGWSQGFNSKDIKVGVIDTGITESYDSSHSVGITQRLNEEEKTQISQITTAWNVTKAASTDQQNLKDILGRWQHTLTSQSLDPNLFSSSTTKNDRQLASNPAINFIELEKNGIDTDLSSVGVISNVPDKIRYGINEKKFLIDYRMDTNNVDVTDLSTYDAMTSIGKKDEHGTSVSRVLLATQPKVKIVMSKIDFSKPYDLSNQEASMAAGMIKKGVRIINRSFAESRNINTKDKTVYTTSRASSFAPYILYDNLLVISAAGNAIGSEYTRNAITESSPLRRGWLVVSGYTPWRWKRAKPDAVTATAEEKVRYAAYKKNHDQNVTLKDKRIYMSATNCNIARLDCVVAPFRFTLSNLKGGDVLNGTSYGTPYVSAIASTILHKYPWMSNSNIKDSILTTADKVIIDGTVQQDIDPVWGWGVVNPKNAMNGPAKFYEKKFIADVTTKQGQQHLSVFSNDISGDQELIKTGLGQLALTGDNTFTGKISINKGLLWVAGTNVAPIDVNGRGSVLRTSIITRPTYRGIDQTTSGSIRNSGTIILDNPHKINGDFEQNQYGMLVMDAENSIKPSLEITGKAKLDGTLAVSGIKIGIGKSVTGAVLLKARYIEGTFAKVVANQVFFKALATQYSGNYVLINFEQNTAATLTKSSESTLGKAAANFDKLSNTVDETLYKVDVNDDKYKVDSALLISDMSQIGEDVKDKMNQNYKTLVEAGRFVSTHGSVVPASDTEFYSAQIKYLDNGKSSLKRIVSSKLKAEAATLLEITDIPTLEKALYSQGASLYANNNQIQASTLNNQFINNGRISGELNLYLDNKSSEGNFNYLDIKGKVKNFTTSFNYTSKFNEYNYGIALNRNNSNYSDNFRDAAQANTNSTSLQLQLTGGYQLADNKFVDFSVAKSWIETNAVRSIFDGKVDKSVTSNSKAQYNSIGSVYSKKIAVNNMNYLGYLGINFANYNQYGFVEKSESDFALNIKKASLNVSTAFVGIKAQAKLNQYFDVSLAAKYQYSLGKFDLKGNFIGAADTEIETNHLDLGKSVLDISGNLTVNFNEIYLLNIYYAKKLSNKFQISSYGLNLGIRF